MGEIPSASKSRQILLLRGRGPLPGDRIDECNQPGHAPSGTEYELREEQEPDKGSPVVIGQAAGGETMLDGLATLVQVLHP